MAYNIITTSQLLDRIEGRCANCQENRPPFTLVIGSGFSHPLIPTTSEMVCKDIPWWKWCKSKEVGGPQPPDFNDSEFKGFAEQAKQNACELWKEDQARRRCALG